MARNDESLVSHCTEKTDINHMDASKILQSLELKEEEEQMTSPIVLLEDAKPEVVFNGRKELEFLRTLPVEEEETPKEKKLRDERERMQQTHSPFLVGSDYKMSEVIPQETMP